jgi:hypothetical protein
VRRLTVSSLRWYVKPRAVVVIVVLLAGCGGSSYNRPSSSQLPPAPVNRPTFSTP